MQDKESVWIDVSQLRRGLFVQLDLGWMDHPFPKGSFRIASEEQIDRIRALGLSQVRYFPAQSDADAVAPVDAVIGIELNGPSASGLDGLDGGTGQADGQAAATATATATAIAPSRALPAGFTMLPPVDRAAPLPEATVDEAGILRAQRREKLSAQQRSLQVCERSFNEAMRQFRRVAEQASSKPIAAREQSEVLVAGCVNDILADGESAIRLLSETMGDRSAEHPVNVMVISLLLGKALGLPAAEMHTLGVAALVHDLGKAQLPERMRYADPSFSETEQQCYREHVGHSLMVAQRMALSDEVRLAVAQHHEMMDGTGFPGQLRGDGISAAGKILALVNYYDNLCNPARLVNALTPHEALSLIFAQMKPRFDSLTLGAFIRMMGVYPPGSVVQLANEGFAMVVSVNSSRPLKPRVIVHDTSVPREEALIVDLEDAPALGIRRSMKPSQLPRAALEYLSPRPRTCYYYERAFGADRSGQHA
jgi:HD-GYP domain-containing protein (c-di-GMP phosphodiesterase class II)